MLEEHHFEPTPNLERWLAAIEAGAHIFIEKPTGHTIGESQAILAAARAEKRVVQVAEIGLGRQNP